MVHLTPVMVHQWTSDGPPIWIIFVIPLPTFDPRTLISLLSYFVGLLNLFWLSRRRWECFEDNQKYSTTTKWKFESITQFLQASEEKFKHSIQAYRKGKGLSGRKGPTHSRNNDIQTKRKLQELQHWKYFCESEKSSALVENYQRR